MMSGAGTLTGVIEWAIASRALPGQAQSGDLHLVAALPSGALVAAIDGLGHGDESRTAAVTAVATLERNAGEHVVTATKRCHEALRGTRGAAVSVASFDALESAMTWLGVGNVEGVLLRAQEGVRPRRQWLLLRGGVVGYHLPPLRASVVPLARGDVLVFATDGLRSGFADDIDPRDAPRRIADRLLDRSGRDTDDALVLVARYLGGAP